MGDIGDLHAFAVLLLDSCAEALDTVHAYDATLEGAQSRQFVSPGQPVDDCCGQLAVHVQLISQEDTSPGGSQAGKRPIHGAINTPLLQVRSTRCIPTGTGTPGVDYREPSAVALQEAARQLDADAWALWNHLFALQSSGLLRSLCDQVFFDGISAIQPSGGCAGWIAQIRVSLDGYPVSFGS